MEIPIDINLANTLSLLSLQTAFMSIFMSFTDRPEIASAAILISIILDAFDGPAARLSKSETGFGERIDSLSDLVAFGVAPAILLIVHADMHPALAGLYLTCAAIRLARFTHDYSGFFTGLPTTTGAGLIACAILAGMDTGNYWPAIPLIALLMVSKIQYPNPDITLENKKTLFLILAPAVLLAAGMGFAGVVVAQLGYIVFGPALMRIRPNQKPV